MQKSIRQSMAWLHSWTGLLLGWLLFVIFVLGSISYYKNDVTAWMQPELHQIEVNQEYALNSVFKYLSHEAPDAKTWFINLASDESATTRVFWQAKDGSFTSKLLDPNTAKDVQLSPTQGGDFFYNFHFQLFGVPIIIGRLLVSFAACIMLIAMISGIITHKKIFAEFFTLRTFKSQRSWLDFHNMVSVIALPFFLMIAFTGLAMFFYLYLPTGLQKFYPDNRFGFFDEIRTTQIEQPKNLTPKPSQMIPIEKIQSQIKKLWPNQPEIDSIQVIQPFTDQAKIVIKQKEDRTITLNSDQLTFSLTTGEILNDLRNQHPVAKLYGGIYGLHMAPFAGPILKLAFFFSGILGCLMIASGLLLWSVKRQIQNKAQRFHLGHYLVDRLNVATFVGLPTAIICYLYTNRLYTLSHPNSPNQEISVFFISWLIMLCIACISKKQSLWSIQLFIFIVLSALLPITSIIVLLYFDYIQSLHDYMQYIQFDVFIWLFCGLSLFLWKNISPIQKQVQKKMQSKYQPNHGQKL